jgi:hypothetical protein
MRHSETALYGYTSRPSGLDLPETLGFKEWRAVGSTLDVLIKALLWAAGDWCAFGEHRYGSRKALTDAADWQGPSLRSCMDAASVCRKFSTSRRREALSFSHHSEVAALPPALADELLAWYEKALLAGKRLGRSTRELRAEMHYVCPRQTSQRVGMGEPRRPGRVDSACPDGSLRKKELTPTATLAAIVDATDEVLATSAVDKLLRAKLKRLLQALAGTSGHASAA